MGNLLLFAALSTDEVVMPVWLDDLETGLAVLRSGRDDQAQLDEQLKCFSYRR